MHGQTYTQIQPAFAVAYGPASAELNGVRLSGDGQTKIVTSPINPFPNPVPLTLALRQQFGRLVESSVDLGWVNSGIELRLAVPWAIDLPVALRAGARTGKVSAFDSDTYEGRIGAEAYPRISRDGYPSLRFVFSLAVSGGSFEHEILLPSSYAETLAGPGIPHAPVADVVRREIRLEGTIGVTWAREHVGCTLAVAPWILVAAAAPSSLRCIDCNGPETVTQFSQSWGLALLLVPSFGWDGRRAPRAP